MSWLRKACRHPDPERERERGQGGETRVLPISAESELEVAHAFLVIWYVLLQSELVPISEQPDGFADAFVPSFGSFSKVNPHDELSAICRR